MTPVPPPFQEPLRKTLLRTFLIAFVVGGAIALASRKLSIWPLASVLVLWPSFGGHWVEVFYLNLVRPRISPALGALAATRILVWFAGGCLLFVGMLLTASAFVQFKSPPWITWWIGGMAFVGIELFMHLTMQLRALPNFYDGRG